LFIDTIIKSIENSPLSMKSLTSLCLQLFLKKIDNNLVNCYDASMFIEKHLKILGLNEKENSLLRALQKSHGSPSSLSKILNLPRTTITFLLKKLYRRGLVEKERIGQRFFWKAVAPSQFAHTLRMLSRHFDPFTKSLEIIKGKRESTIELYRGKEKMKEALQKALKIGKGRRVYSLQGNKSVTTSFEKMEWEFIKKYQDKIKKKGIIIEGVIGESTLGFLEKMTKKQLAGHLGRLTVAYVAPDEFFNFALDLMIFKNIVMIINYEEETVLLIKDSYLQEMMQQNISFMEKHSRKVYLDTYIHNFLKTSI